MKCFEGSTHVGELVEILAIETGEPGGEEIVRWCPHCGAIVVDKEYDGRLFPGRAMKMRFPMWRVNP